MKLNALVALVRKYNFCVVQQLGLLVFVGISKLLAERTSQVLNSKIGICFTPLSL